MEHRKAVSSNQILRLSLTDTLPFTITFFVRSQLWLQKPLENYKREINKKQVFLFPKKSKLRTPKLQITRTHERKVSLKVILVDVNGLCCNQNISY